MVLHEAEVLADGLPRRFGYTKAEDPFTELRDSEFIKLYRLKKELAQDLYHLLEPYMEPANRISAISIEKKILTTLQFYASGSYQGLVGRSINHIVSQSSVSRSIEEVTNALCRREIFEQYIKLPRNIHELVSLRNSFYLNHQLPGVIGCVDCTHVAIFPPRQFENNEANIPQEVLYVNRKGYHSINTQLICDDKLKIMNVNARFPGSSNDAFIWNNSNASQYMRNLHQAGNTSFYLLGDSGYALRPWMMTPFANAAPNSPENRYNERQRSTRSLIERCNGVLKMRFRCLLKHRVLHYQPAKCSRIINACCVLHNMCLDHNMPPVDLEVDEADIDLGMYPEPAGINNEERNRADPELREGRRVQRGLIRHYQ